MTRAGSQDKPVNTPAAAPAAPVKTKQVELPESMSVKQLSELLHVSAVDVIKQLMRAGIMANITQAVDYDTAVTVAAAFEYEVKKAETGRKTSSAILEMKKRQAAAQEKEPGFLRPRPPVVTIMGHVDHGKTRLLDAIRQTNVVDQEAGGITQHIGAYQVETNGHKITFLDTPGHQAFTAMRARGAQVTDIAVLVVAADDGVMPQTLEAIDHARAAGVPIIVAINKVDKPEANPDRIKQQLADAGLVVEDWGGDTIAVPVSAKAKQNISGLLENILLVAEMEDLKADPLKPATGVVIEAKLDKSKGPMATVLIGNGTLRLGDTVVVGNTWGRIKAMFTDSGKQMRKADPSTPVGILGLIDVPQEGDVLRAVPDERKAKELVEKNKAASKKAAGAPISLTNLFEQVSAGRVQELNIVLKTDVQGSIEPINNSLAQLSTDQVKVRIIHSGSGRITESDVMLAAASKGVVIGFNADSDTGARRLAESEGVSIRNYDIIYNVVDDIAKALKGMLAPTIVEVIEGRADIRAVFSAGKKAKAAGIYVTEGKITRGSTVRIKRKDKVIAESPVQSLRRFKDDVREVATGYEAGIVLDTFSDFEVADVLEAYRIEKST